MLKKNLRSKVPEKPSKKERHQRRPDLQRLVWTNCPRRRRSELRLVGCEVPRDGSPSMDLLSEVATDQMLARKGLMSGTMLAKL